MDEIGKTMASIMQLPYWLTVPSVFMKQAIGKKCSLVLEGQQVLPEMLWRDGIEFSFSSLESGLTVLLT
jgi:NAD dependent epimerase/dehydratase family enzyme